MINRFWFLVFALWVGLGSIAIAFENETYTEQYRFPVDLDPGVYFARIFIPLKKSNGHLEATENVDANVHSLTLNSSGKLPFPILESMRLRDLALRIEFADGKSFENCDLAFDAVDSYGKSFNFVSLGKPEILATNEFLEPVADGRDSNYWLGRIGFGSGKKNAWRTDKAEFRFLNLPESVDTDIYVVTEPQVQTLNARFATILDGTGHVSLAPKFIFSNNEKWWKIPSTFEIEGDRARSTQRIELIAHFFDPDTPNTVIKELVIAKTQEVFEAEMPRSFRSINNGYYEVSAQRELSFEVLLGSTLSDSLDVRTYQTDCSETGKATITVKPSIENSENLRSLRLGQQVSPLIFSKEGVRSSYPVASVELAPMVDTKSSRDRLSSGTQVGYRFDFTESDAICEAPLMVKFANVDMVDFHVKYEFQDGAAINQYVRENSLLRIPIDACKMLSSVSIFPPEEEFSRPSMTIYQTIEQGYNTASTFTVSKMVDFSIPNLDTDVVPSQMATRLNDHFRLLQLSYQDEQSKQIYPTVYCFFGQCNSSNFDVPNAQNALPYRVKAVQSLKLHELIAREIYTISGSVEKDTVIQSVRYDHTGFLEVTVEPFSIESNSQLRTRMPDSRSIILLTHAVPQNNSNETSSQHRGGAIKSLAYSMGFVMLAIVCVVIITEIETKTRALILLLIAFIYAAVTGEFGFALVILSLLIVNVLRIFITKHTSDICVHRQYLDIFSRFPQTLILVICLFSLPPAIFLGFSNIAELMGVILWIALVSSVVDIIKEYKDSSENNS